LVERAKQCLRLDAQTLKLGPDALQSGLERRGPKTLSRLRSMEEQRRGNMWEKNECRGPRDEKRSQMISRTRWMGHVIGLAPIADEGLSYQRSYRNLHRAKFAAMWAAFGSGC
jgi:hypothetical protein